MSNLFFNSVAQNLNQVQLEKFNAFVKEFEEKSGVKANLHYTVEEDTPNGLKKDSTVIFESQWDGERNEPLIVVSNFNYRSSIVVYADETINKLREKKPELKPMEEFHERQKDLASVTEMSELLKGAKFALARNFYEEMLKQLKDEVKNIEKILEENK